MIAACSLAFGGVGVKERVKSVMNYRKPAFWMVALAVITCVTVAICFLTNPEKEYQIRVIIPAGSTEEMVYQDDFFYSEEEISPTGNKITISLGEGIGDTEVVLKPIEVKEENAYGPTYITPGMPIKMDVEKGAWFKIGVNMKNPTPEDIHVYVEVRDVEVRIAEGDSNPGEETGKAENPETSEVSDVQRHYFGDLDGNGTEEFMEISEEGRLEDYDGYMSFYFNGDRIYEYDALLNISPGNVEYIDLDMDGKSEIFFTLFPRVNSMPLMEYAVLKKVGNEWKALEMIHGETMQGNAFPISVQYGKEKNTIVMTCEGIQEQIIYDFTAYYEGLIAEYKEEGLYTEDFEHILKDSGYREGDSFGGVASWGIWTIKSAQHDGRNCLVATHGIEGPVGRTDILGELDIYFNYNKEGHVNILNMEFRENSVTFTKSDGMESDLTENLDKNLLMELTQKDAEKCYVTTRGARWVLRDKYGWQVSMMDTSKIARIASDNFIFE